MAALVIGLVMLAVFALIWAGPLRGALDSPLWPFGWLTVIPGMGVMLTAVGLELVGVLPDDTPVVTLALVVLIAAWVLFFWQPDWWGPRWYRHRQDQP
jgi:hypothetical protein